MTSNTTNKVYLYAAMLAQKPRSVLTAEQLVNVKLNSTRKLNATKEELSDYLDKKPMHTSRGDYLIENNVVRGNEGYASVFCYDKAELESHMDKYEGSVSGYRGNCYSDWLYFDMENKEHGPQYVKKQLIPLLDYLVENKIKYLLFYSGNAGIHLYIPMEYLRVPEEYVTKANVVAKVFMRMIIQSFPTMKDIVDKGVYGINTVFRKPFSINPKSGLLKTLLNYTNGEFVRINNDNDIFYALTQAMFMPSDKDIKPIWTLDESFLKEAVASPAITTYNKEKFPAPYGEKVCMYRILNTPLSKGENRQQIGLRLMGWWRKDKQYPAEYVWKLMETWNSRLADPLPITELRHMFKSVETINFNLCKDPIIERYCPKTSICPEWKVKNSNIISLSITEAFAAVDEDVANKGIEIDFNTIFPGTNIYARPDRGQILGIVGGGKVGKSVVATNIAMRATDRISKEKVPTVIFSYEISALGVLASLAAQLGLDIYDTNDRKDILEATSHIYIIDNGRTAFQDVPTQVSIIERKYNVKIKMVILDYLQMVPVFNINRPGYFITSWVEALGVISQLAPEMVKKYKWLMILPTQPTKGVEGGGNTILLPDSARGGQAYTAMLDFGLTIWRPFKNVNPEIISDDDQVISIWAGINRWGREGTIHNYNWDGKKRLVYGLWDGTLKQKQAIVQKN